MNKLHIDDIDVKGKRVLVRVDFNVPLDEHRAITDDARIRAAIPTIRKLIDRGARVVLMSHLGRPKGQRKPEMSLMPAAERLAGLLKEPVAIAPDCIGPEVEKLVGALDNGQVILLENLRFHKEETDNAPNFAKQLASLGDIYVNDAFGTAHRAHASTEGVAHFFEVRAAGDLMQKEIDFLGQALRNPERPFLAILGGAKISGKIDVIENLLNKVDEFLIGGGMAFAFIKAQGSEIGKTLFEEGTLPVAQKVLYKTMELGIPFGLPDDCLIADQFSAGANIRVVSSDEIPPDWMALDIGPITSQTFVKRIESAQTIVWNGPMGVFEFEAFRAGTHEIAKALAEATDRGATTIIGGGDSAAALAQLGLTDRVSHVSTGGGASLEFLEGKTLPGIAVLSDRPS
ncbi:MAG: phosphoglycerate kinase [Phycisphaerae bacterium SM23_30]|nr:MAG: phosphoglycerate kinase [Phycisphaerae bacterium SM23_30]